MIRDEEGEDLSVAMARIEQEVRDASKAVGPFGLGVDLSSTWYGDGLVPLNVFLADKRIFQIYVHRDNINSLTFSQLAQRVHSTGSYADDRMLSHEYIYDCAMEEKEPDKEKLNKLILADSLK